MEKVHNFLHPPVFPQDVLDFFEIGENGNLMIPPLDLILNFGTPPLRTKNISLKYLKLPKITLKLTYFWFN